MSTRRPPTTADAIRSSGNRAALRSTTPATRTIAHKTPRTPARTAAWSLAALAAGLAFGACNATGTGQAATGQAATGQATSATPPSEPSPTPNHLQIVGSAPSRDHRREGARMDGPGPLGLSDADFWTDPRRTRDAVQQPYMQANKEALIYDAPREVVPGARQTLPTQVLRVATFATLSAKPFRSTAIVVGVDLERNYVKAAIAVRPSPRESDPSTPIESGPPPEGVQGAMGAETFTIDLRERLELPWEPGSVLARLIVLDDVSEPRLIRLVPSAGFLDPEVEKTRLAERAKTNVPTLRPPPDGPGVSFLRDKNSPPLPEVGKPGLTLSAPRVFALDADQPCMLRGSFRLPILKKHIVPQTPVPKAGTEEIYAQLAPRVRLGEPMATGVIPITLVATGSSIADPLIWRLIVPTYDRLDASSDGALVTGAFALDARTLEGFDVLEQTFFLYAFSGEEMAGPLVIGLTRK
ncbi:MAG: hypothetical protein SFZ23_13345 [Planctomycetota bacterium]|nr:hypothetical protein [Planctomycetota bacterium]